ncbi:hypothetical protein C923_02882 [Plasmodium falciparum UGT5.1]|uniref:Uncharacterized protein n=3 Tax=Plasmodium falciparum TaxID=5833 RepID=W7JXZ3_PLAFA|nr:hypothetical protein PFFVO_02791 [Plasmodium falciparum Vietnam Oak-Knoll (FVO)]EUR71844.1 hypothetical protein PFBG_02870 [Plasmodium falciparum 7G8]EWC76461.1 hypothetical protein C923_02882 [Plasmodium falciparum UGT5.1]
MTVEQTVEQTKNKQIIYEIFIKCSFLFPNKHLHLYDSKHYYLKNLSKNISICEIKKQKQKKETIKNE